MPFYSRDGRPLGVAQALNRTRGSFNEEDRAFLKMFNNHAAVFIEMAQLQRARIEALERSRLELERLNRAKTKAINHVSHELKTPLAVIQGNIRLLKQRLQALFPDPPLQDSLDSLERHLRRLLEIQKEARQIFRVAKELEAGSLIDELERLERKVGDFSEMPAEVRVHWKAVKEWISAYLPGEAECFKPIHLYPFIKRLVKKTESHAPHRELRFSIEGDGALMLSMASSVLREVLDGLIKNAVENTPDGGKIQIILEKKERKVYIHVEDYGIGITEENRLCLFDGLSPARETELYASKKPYDFGAGGKGLDLLRMKLYAERFGFSLSLESRRCAYIPTDQDLCPGKISLCVHCKNADDCATSGGSRFTAAFPAAGGSR